MGSVHFDLKSCMLIGFSAERVSKFGGGLFLGDCCHVDRSQTAL